MFRLKQAVIHGGALYKRIEEVPESVIAELVERGFIEPVAAAPPAAGAKQEAPAAVKKEASPAKAQPKGEGK